MDSILSQMLKEDKSEQEKENGECPYNLVVAYDWMGRMEHNIERHESLRALFLYLFFLFFFPIVTIKSGYGMKVPDIRRYI